MKETVKLKEPKAVERKEEEKHSGFYKGPHNQTLKANTHGEHEDGKRHENHHPAVKMSKGE